MSALIKVADCLDNVETVTDIPTWGAKQIVPLLTLWKSLLKSLKFQRGLLDLEKQKGGWFETSEYKEKLESSVKQRRKESPWRIRDSLGSLTNKDYHFLESINQAIQSIQNPDKND
jgi:hypothetical protein